EAVADDLANVATEEQVAAAILDASATNHNTPGTIGAAINTSSEGTPEGVAEAVWDAVLGDNADDTASAWLRRVKAAVYDSIQVTGTGGVRTLTLSDGTVQVVSGMARVT